ncbi:MAG: hypothetical protein H6738_06520 [Alphaproteobacteria bacterium]|nr:hypothetical protein [Alphaproteobacteria bacterium]MCB9696415.1 hypothetical protein [Alphaproteobacteria bacterium]
MDTTTAQQRAAFLAWSTARLWREGRLVEARGACEEALALQLAAGSPTAVASVRTTLGRILRTMGEVTDAHEQLSSALARHLLDGDERLVALTRQELAGLALLRGRPEIAVELLGEAAAAHVAAGDDAFEVRAMLLLLRAHHAAGRLDDAFTQVRMLWPAVERTGDPSLIVDLAAAAGHLLLERGSAKEAIRAYGRGLAVTDGTPPWAEVELRLGVARARLDRGALDAAWLEASAAAELASSSTLRLDEGVAWATVAMLAAREGRVGEARDAIATAEERLACAPTWLALTDLAAATLELREDRTAAFRGLTEVPDEALSVVPVRLAMRALRTWAAGG